MLSSSLHMRLLTHWASLRSSIVQLTLPGTFLYPQIGISLTSSIRTRFLRVSMIWFSLFVSTVIQYVYGLALITLSWLFSTVATPEDASKMRLVKTSKMQFVQSMVPMHSGILSTEEEHPSSSTLPVLCYQEEFSWQIDKHQAFLQANTHWLTQNIARKHTLSVCDSARIYYLSVWSSCVCIWCYSIWW